MPLTTLMNSVKSTKSMKSLPRASLLALLLGGAGGTALAQEAWGYKYTHGFYSMADSHYAQDANLRLNKDDQVIWIGHYWNPSIYQQTRAGYEHTIATAWGQLTPSLQIASGGFVSGALSGQVGSTNYLIWGIDRTNDKDYYNLNFDPNNAITLGVGTKAMSGAVLSAFTTQTYRLGLGQRITHLVWRQSLEDKRRLTVDLAYKHGREAPDASKVHGTSLVVTYDFDRYFVRAGRDLKVNFSQDNQTRIAAGLRF